MYTTIFVVIFLLVIAYYLGLFLIFTITKEKTDLFSLSMYYSNWVMFGLAALLIIALLLDGTLFTGGFNTYF